ncbi:MAG: pyruvate kinase alpha/beta domain-containing protein [Candidatus Bathyarchaeia archaeon]
MSVKKTTVYFQKAGKENTEETLKIAVEAAKERNIETIVVSSTTGRTGLLAMELLRGSNIKLVVVAHQTGYREPGLQLMPEEARKRLEESGATVVIATDVLTGGCEVGISRQPPPKEAQIEARLPFIVPPVPVIIAHTLRLFSQGVKVCVEIAMMAADAGVIPVTKPIVSVAGSHEGADTALTLTPANSNRIRDLKIHEILAKPL